MKPSLAKWIGDADALRHFESFQVPQASVEFAHILQRTGDYYLALVGDLFEMMRSDAGAPADWARLGNALAQLAADGQDSRLASVGISKSETTLLSAAAFYCGGFPASAYVTLRGNFPAEVDSETYRACFDLLAHPNSMTSQAGRSLVAALRAGDMATLARIGAVAVSQSAEALKVGPEAWISARLFERLTARFLVTNVRKVLPDGSTEFWTPFVSSLLNRKPPTWEFFPSQIEAIQRGLLESTDTFSLQMPTGAGKTALCEALLYWHTKASASTVAVFLVPYRSLASELRATVVKRLNALGISARCAYGGTIPSGDEVHELTDTRVVVATPESLSGLLAAGGDFFGRVSLVICDEGHLLDGGARGIGLELLLARMRAREGGPPRFVFVSAIVPNIEEINVWLGGTTDGVVRSDYRPALAEYAVLRPSGTGTNTVVALEMHPHEQPPTRFVIGGFLSRTDFTYQSAETGRRRTYTFTSVKAQAIAAARKALTMGASAVFAANKRGDQGAVGLAEELLEQLTCPLTLPAPITFAKVERIAPVAEYLSLEYGPEWLGARAVAAGAVLHHGDIPQESREVLEGLLRAGDIAFVICTTTLAEGVNLPIRTLVLYSVQRRLPNGRPDPLLSRDIKNLVGRAGRAGATTKGLVICANAQHWGQVEQVARQAPGESVHGALRELVSTLRDVIADRGTPLTNADIEGAPFLHTLADGIDATLVDLAAEEIGEDVLVAEAGRIADQTFASQTATAQSKQFLRTVFELRARRVFAVRAAGRIGWIRETGARLRMIDVVETQLLIQRERWDDIAEPLDANVVSIFLEWTWTQPEVQEAVRESYRLVDDAATDTVKTSFFAIVNAWLRGGRFRDVATLSQQGIDDVLGIHGRVVTYLLQTLVEQAVALLARLLEARGEFLSPAVLAVPDHLRFGVPTSVARLLAPSLRHRTATVELGNALRNLPLEAPALLNAAREGLRGHEAAWRERLGRLVYENTMNDLTAAIGDGGASEAQ